MCAIVIPRLCSRSGKIERLVCFMFDYHACAVLAHHAYEASASIYFWFGGSMKTSLTRDEVGIL